MADKPDESRTDKDKPQSPSPPLSTPKPLRQVVVTHLDEPPSIGKNRIHPRRPAPIVPTREERIRQETDDPKKDDPKNENPQKNK